MTNYYPVSRPAEAPPDIDESERIEYLEGKYEYECDRADDRWSERFMDD